jgi:hypothetical protein
MLFQDSRAGENGPKAAAISHNANIQIATPTARLEENRRHSREPNWRFLYM